MNSRWIDRAAALAVALVLAGSGLVAGCGDEAPAGKPAAAGLPADPAQADADSLGREVFEIVDRVMAYRSAHQRRLPTSLRQAGLDSLTGSFLRSLGRSGGDPRVTIRFRRPGGHVLERCAGTNLVLEQAMMNEGAFEVECLGTDGGRRSFTVTRP